MPNARLTSGQGRSAEHGVLNDAGVRADKQVRERRTVDEQWLGLTFEVVRGCDGQQPIRAWSGPSVPGRGRANLEVAPTVMVALIAVKQHERRERE